MTSLYFTACAQHQGTRDEQQDRMITKVTDGLCYGVLCDGMGGHDGGARAADVALQAVAHALTAGMQTMDVVASACAAVRAGVRHGHRDRAPGTTLVYWKLHGNCARIVHAGDSRAYVVRQGASALVQLTKDHNLAAVYNEDAVAEGRPLTTDGSNVLLSNIPDAAKVDEIDVELQVGDWLLLASDGWYAEMEQNPGAVISWLTDESKCNRADIADVLIKLYLGHYSDNATVCLLRRVS